MNPLKSWRFKGLIQKVLSTTPGGIHANDLLQKHLGGLKRFDQNISAKVRDWVGIIALARGASTRSLPESTVLEIGSGWYPTLPICFSLCGVKKITTVDLNQHMNAQLTFKALQSLSNHIEDISSAAGVPMAIVQSRYDEFSSTRTLNELLEVARIEYLAPADAARLPSVPNSSLDIVYSNSVLEHVPRDVIPSIMTETRRTLKDDGLMIHAVACNDHYAHFDRSISFVNYLSYDKDQWQFWNNSLQFQNRMRAPEFLEMADRCGFRVLHEARAIRPGTREALATMRVSREFAHFSVEDLAATTVDFVARKKITAPSQ